MSAEVAKRVCLLCTIFERHYGEQNVVECPVNIRSMQIIGGIVSVFFSVLDKAFLHQSILAALYSSLGHPVYYRKQ